MRAIALFAAPFPAPFKAPFGMPLDPSFSAFLDLIKIFSIFQV
jgi:hypothetical protein